MKRLSALLSEAEGSMDVALEFTSGHEMATQMHGRISGQVLMICQRCLLPMKVDIDRQFDLGFAYSEQEATRMQSAGECYEMQGDEVFVRDIIEDELILSLPQFPVHSNVADCDLDVISKLKDAAT